jgi:hypothetical protein
MDDEYARTGFCHSCAGKDYSHTRKCPLVQRMFEEEVLAACDFGPPQTGGYVWECGLCGAAASNKLKHAKWHRRTEEAIRDAERAAFRVY